MKAQATWYSLESLSDWGPGWPVVVGRVDSHPESPASLEGAPSLGGWLGRAEKRGLPVSQGGVLLQGLCGKRWQLLQVSPHHFIAARQGQTGGVAETHLTREKTTSPRRETRPPPSGPHAPHLRPFSEKGSFLCPDSVTQGDAQHAEPAGLCLWCMQQGRVEPSGMPEGSFQACMPTGHRWMSLGSRNVGEEPPMSPKGGP